MCLLPKDSVMRKDHYKGVRINSPDWQTMKALCNKLKVPMVQLQHDMTMVYSSFIYGVDRATEHSGAINDTP
jgi:hypothetical protein